MGPFHPSAERHPGERAAAKFGAEPRLGRVLYLHYFKQIRRIHRQALGIPLRTYKRTEPECVERAMATLLRSRRRGASFAALVLHELVWAQCLGNANHRTAVAFLQGYLNRVGGSFPSASQADLRGSKREFLGRMNAWSTQSKTLIEHADGTLKDLQAAYERRHLALTVLWVRKEIGRQSTLRTNVGPHSLRSFLSLRESGRSPRGSSTARRATDSVA